VNNVSKDGFFKIEKTKKLVVRARKPGLKRHSGGFPPRTEGPPLANNSLLITTVSGLLLADVAGYPLETLVQPAWQINSQG